MTLKPQLIRADTLDLQDHDTPSAQDHARNPHPPPLGAGPAAPHQQKSLRHAIEGRTAEENHLADNWGSGRSSGRSSHEGSDLLDDETRLSGEDTHIDEAALRQDGDESGISSDGEGEELAESRESLTSSPSIDDDGMCTPLLDVDGKGGRSSPEMTTIDFDQSVRNSLAEVEAAGITSAELNKGHKSSRVVPNMEFESAWDLFEPEPDAGPPPPPLSHSVDGPAAQKEPVSESQRPLHSFATSTDECASDRSLASSREPASADESDWEDLSDGSSSIEGEEIDPDYVYALSAFQANVDGQANAAKGDAMMLLDDSNSYWWLVRLVKDSSIGYLPAEQIEMPNEREARQNKHRNLELARTHLTDDPGRSKNPLKKAMRRRNAKKVEFSTPTYYEPDPRVWPPEEEDEANEDGLLNDDTQAQNERDGYENGSSMISDETNGDLADRRPLTRDDEQLQAPQASASMTSTESDGPHHAMDHGDQATKTSRNGAIRNTDSFFNDDSAEPRKISLTPNMLRDSTSETSSRGSGSVEKLATDQDIFSQVENTSPTAEKTKEDKKRKDKKPGMLSGLFKRKDKKIKVDEAAGGVVAKSDTEPTSPTSTSGDLSPVSASSPTSPPVKRSISNGKLTKAPPPGMIGPVSAPRTPTEATFTPGPVIEQPQELQQPAAPTRQAPMPSQILASSVDSRGFEYSKETSADFTPRGTSTGNTNERFDSPLNREKDQAALPQAREPSQHSKRPSMPGGYESVDSIAVRPASPVQDVPELEHSEDTKRESTDSSGRTVSPPSPPEPDVNEPLPAQPVYTRAAESVQSRSPQRPHWNAAAYKAYLDARGNQDAKDLLLLVSDPIGVKPLPLDHPTMLGFGFHEQQRQLNDMSQRLDAMLNGFLARKAARPKARS